MTTPSPRSPLPRAEKSSIRTAILWGVVVGALQAASPLGFWWLFPATVYALGLAVIAFVYIGFAVADGRGRVIALECAVALAFVVRLELVRHASVMGIHSTGRLARPKRGRGVLPLCRFTSR